MGTGSRTPPALAAVVLLLCALVAATSTPVTWSGIELPWADPATSAEDVDDQPDQDPEARTEDQEGRQEDGTRVVPTEVGELGRLLLAGVALAAAAAVVVAVLRLRLVRRRSRLTGRATARVGATPDPGAADEDADDVLAGALDDGLEALATGSPRNAIVATWLRLEEAVSSERFPRKPSETPTELVARALAAYRLDPVATARLAELYEEARFSRHPVTEAHRREAQRCLVTLLRSLQGVAR